MYLMLAVIFIYVGLGLVVPRIDRRTHALVAALATAMTALYYVKGSFM